MTDQFCKDFQVCLEQLVAPLRFHHRPSGELVGVSVHEAMLPAKPVGYQEGDELPLLRWCIYEGEFSGRVANGFSVALDAGIYSPGSIIDGSRDLMLLINTLGGLARMHGLPPYKLRTPISFRLGDPRDGNEGIQPHPYYYGRLTMDFIYAGPGSACKP